MNPVPQSDLIFDLGMHRGKDTDFYLRKGFRVVALEANPDLCAKARQTFAAQIASGQLTIVEAALQERDETTISFYVNPEKDDWSSVQKQWAEKGGHTSIEIKVATITLGRLFERHGIPHYIKCDIEGADLLFTEQLRESALKPNFVSVEAIGQKLLENLRDAGYRRFAIVNQALNWAVRHPNPPREGQFAEVRFDGHMSGLFGRELPEDKWLDFDECLTRWRMFRDLRQKDETLAHGWLDFHASH